MGKKNVCHKTDEVALACKDVANNFVMTVVATVMSDFDLDFEGAKHVLERVGFWEDVNDDCQMALQAQYDFDALDAIKVYLRGNRDAVKHTENMCKLKIKDIFIINSIVLRQLLKDFGMTRDEAIRIWCNSATLKAILENNLYLASPMQCYWELIMEATNDVNWELNSFSHDQPPLKRDYTNDRVIIKGMEQPKWFYE
jgi:hypothetical protein